MKKQNPKEQASFLSSLFLCWLNGLIRLGNQRPLCKDDLFPLTDQDKSKVIVEHFQQLWDIETKEARKLGRKPRLWKVMFRFIPAKSCIRLILLKLVESLTNFTSVVLLWMYLSLLQHETISYSRLLYILVLGIGASSLVKAFALNHNNLEALLKGMRLKTACIGMVYRKVLASTRSSISRVTVGYIINLVSNDAQRMDKIPLALTFGLISLVDFPFTIALLYVLVDWQSLSGPLVVVVISFVVTLLSIKLGKLQAKQGVLTDNRLTTLNEIITGIRAVKMYAWEWKYRNKVKDLRRKEINLLCIKRLIFFLSQAVARTLPVTATLASVLTMTWAGTSLNAVNIFTVVSLLNSITESMTLLVYAARTFSDSFVSLNRIEEYLLDDFSHAPQALGKETTNGVLCRPFNIMEQNGDSSKVAANADKLLDGSYDITVGRPLPFVKLNQLSSSWFDEMQYCTLHDISLNLNSNQLVMVVGPVGSGKSTLLMTILREIPIKLGHLLTRGKIAYVGQIPYIFTGTLRDNILFGKEYEKKRYERTIHVCDLFEDVNHFPKGDQSMVGQRGVRLSGGQRARIGLARAVYSDADIFLLDDPLSAVDTKVGQHIFEKCICQELAGKIRILVTHQMQHLHRADEILMLQDGRVVRHGSYSEINKDGAISKWLAEYKTQATMDKSVGTESTKISCRGRDGDEGQDMVEEEEDRQVGTVSWRLYWDLFSSGVPTFLIICVMLLFIIAEGTVVAPSWWLKVITTMPFSKQKSSTTLGIYGGMVAGTTVVVAVRILCLNLAFIRSSEILHDRMALAVLKSPVSFFDTNPVGRIMNRFSKDIGALDDPLPHKFVESAECFFQLFGVIALTGIVSPWFILLIVPTVIMFFVICRFYLKTARELSRMEAINCSPVYEHVSDTIKGLEVIHSLETENSTLEKLYEKQDLYSRSFSLVIITSRWVGLCTDLLCGVFLTAVGFGTLLLSLDPASTGLILTYILTLVRISSRSIRHASEVETQMISVERIQTYTKLPSEPGYDRKAEVPTNWPSQGSLSLRGVSMAYIDGGRSILKDINIDVQAEEKIGIAGRTGAGKSSLLAALFRMPDPQGQVLVDGIDLGTINVQDARRSMAVITQEPFLFKGTLKRNLDPFDHFTEDEIWSALNAVQLVECVQKLDGLLEYSFGEGGSGFSVGERQLLCLARAFLQRRKILVLDEATANVDYKTDHRIQQVIRNTFSGCTVLTIAHRLNTIMDYDRVVVLDGGHVVENESPGVLAARSNGVFAKLLREHADQLQH